MPIFAFVPMLSVIALRYFTEKVNLWAELLVGAVAYPVLRLVMKVIINSGNSLGGGAGSGVNADMTKEVEAEMNRVQNTCWAEATPPTS